MHSPARQHFLRATAALAAASATNAEPQTSDAYQLMMAALVEDRRRLHDIQSIERKIDAKRDMLPKYQPYLAGVLEAGTGAQDDILTTLMVWHLDVGDIAGALPLAQYALAHQLSSSDQYKRNPAAILVEEAADTLIRSNIKPVWENGEIKNAKEDIQAEQLRLLEQIEVLTVTQDMHDQVRAKLYKAIGYLHALQRNFGDAVTALNRALSLDANCGVKKDIERLNPKVG